MKNRNLITNNLQNIKIRIMITLSWMFEILKYIYENYIIFKKTIKKTVTDKIITNKVDVLVESYLNNSIISSSILKESVSPDDEIFKKSDEDFINGISIDDQNEYIYTIKSYKEKYSIVDNFFI